MGGPFLPEATRAAAKPIRTSRIFLWTGRRASFARPGQHASLHVLLAAAWECVASGGSKMVDYWGVVGISSGVWVSSNSSCVWVSSVGGKREADSDAALYYKTYGYNYGSPYTYNYGTPYTYNAFPYRNVYGWY